MTPLEVDFDDAPESFETAAPAAAKVAAPTAIAGRTLPNNPDAERQLLGTIFVDPADVLSRCLEARITPESFHSIENAAIFRAILKLAADSEPIEQATVAEELKADRTFDKKNTFAAIMAVTDGTATTAQATYFIEKVREQAILREAIRAATNIVERAYAYSGGIEDLLADFQDTAKSLAETGTASNASTLMARAFDGSRLIQKPDPVFSIAGTTVCTRGNLTTIYSQAKTGKSAFIAAMMAATMTTPTSGTDTLGVTGPNYSNHAVLHFDTEQSPYDWQQSVKTCLRRAGLEEAPNWLMSFTIAGMEAAKAEAFVHQAVRLAKKTHGGIHSIFIDGVADLVNDPNSPDECFPLVARLHGMAIEYDTSIINILHLNPTAKDKSDKGRGHLGSQLERKCESNLTLKKEDDVTVVCAEGRQRGKPIPADKSPAFKWSDDHGMHRSCANPVKEADDKKPGRGRAPTYTFTEFRPIFPAKSEPPKRMKELHRVAMMSVPVKSESGFYNLLQRFVDEGAIESVEMQGGRGYRLAV